MDAQLFKTMPPGERARYLKANAIRVLPTYTYSRELDPAEMDIRKDMLSQNTINIDRADQALAKAREEYNAVAKPIKQDNKKLLQEIRTRAEEITGEVYVIPDDENRHNVGVYTPEGTLISTRGILPEERQYGIEEAININRAQ